MTITDYAPTEQLRPFVRTYKVIESQTEIVNTVIPDISLAIGFRCKGRTSYINGDDEENLPLSAISGLRRSARLIHYRKDTLTIIVIFKATGASSFFREPLHELFEQSVSLDNLIKREKISIIEEQLAEVQNNSQRISIVERFLISQLFNSRTDKLISTAVERIYAGKGAMKVNKLADDLCISIDAFEKRFRKTVGTSPKNFSAIIKMKSIVGLGRQNKTLTSIALDSGYFDQSHFNKDFKLFTGRTPGDFYRAPTFW